MNSALRAIRVLAIDDDPMVLDLIRVMLKSAPDIDLVAAAEDGASAVTAAIQHRPDVALVDLKMPGMDGIDTTAALTARPGAPAVIILTNFDERDSVPAAMEAGAIGYLLKASARRDLLTAIRDAYAGASPMSPQSAAHLRNGYLNAGHETRRLARAQVASLSARESEIAALVAQELSNPDIAARLHLSQSTVKTHISTIQTKLGVEGRVGIATTIARAE